MTRKEQFEELITIISKSCKRHNIALSECEINLIAVDILGDRKCAKNTVACGEHGCNEIKGRLTEQGGISNGKI